LIGSLRTDTKSPEFAGIFHLIAEWLNRGLNDVVRSVFQMVKKKTLANINFKLLSQRKVL
jgi:hypothetical protein